MVILTDRMSNSCLKVYRISASWNQFLFGTRRGEGPLSPVLVYSLRLIPDGYICRAVKSKCTGKTTFLENKRVFFIVIIRIKYLKGTNVFL